MDNRLIWAGIGGFVGLLLGLVIAPSGPDTAEISEALNGRFEQISTQIQEVAGTAEEMRGGLSALEERLVVLESAYAERGVTLATVAAELSAQIDERIAALDQALETRIQGSRAETAAALEVVLDAVAAAAPPPAGDQPGSQDAQTAAAPAQSAPVQETDADIAAGMLYPTGRTAQAGDGIFRAFVARVDPEAQIVTLSVNGAMTSLAPGQSVTGEVDGQFCRVALVGIRGSSAALDATCRPASAGGSGGSRLATGTAPGSVALLGDGAVRVFVSSVAEDGSAARIAINGVLTQQVSPGETVELDIDGQSCTVTIDAISESRVSFDYGCGS